MQLTEKQKALWDAILAAKRTEICQDCENAIGQCIFAALVSGEGEANKKTLFGLSLRALAIKRAACANGEVKDALSEYSP